MCVLYLPFYHISSDTVLHCLLFDLVSQDLSSSVAFVINSDSRAASTEVTREEWTGKRTSAFLHSAATSLE